MDQETELTRLPFWPRAALGRLGESWITTAEQVVGVAATDAGIKALAEQAGLSEREVADLVARTRDALPPDVRARLSAPADTSQFGRGAIDPTKKGSR